MKRCLTSAPTLAGLPVSGALLSATKPGLVVSDTVKGVLKPGSSKPGKAARASIDSNWVQLYQLPATLMR